jgi:hypothetical protein
MQQSGGRAKTSLKRKKPNTDTEDHTGSSGKDLSMHSIAPLTILQITKTMSLMIYPEENNPTLRIPMQMQTLMKIMKK